MRIITKFSWMFSNGKITNFLLVKNDSIYKKDEFPNCNLQNEIKDELNTSQQLYESIVLKYSKTL